MRLRNDCCPEKQEVFHILSVCLCVQHAKNMRRIISPSVASLAVPYFNGLSHKLYDFWKKKLLDIKCFDFLYNFCQIRPVAAVLFLVDRRTDGQAYEANSWRS